MRRNETEVCISGRVPVGERRAALLDVSVRRERSIIGMAIDALTELFATLTAGRRLDLYRRAAADVGATLANTAHRVEVATCAAPTPSAIDGMLSELAAGLAQAVQHEEPPADEDPTDRSYRLAKRAEEEANDHTTLYLAERFGPATCEAVLAHLHRMRTIDINEAGAVDWPSREAELEAVSLAAGAQVKAIGGVVVKIDASELGEVMTAIVRRGLVRLVASGELPEFNEAFVGALADACAAELTSVATPALYIARERMVHDICSDLVRILQSRADHCRRFLDGVGERTEIGGHPVSPNTQPFVRGKRKAFVQSAEAIIAYFNGDPQGGADSLDVDAGATPPGGRGDRGPRSGAGAGAGGGAGRWTAGSVRLRSPLGRSLSSAVRWPSPPGSAGAVA